MFQVRRGNKREASAHNIFNEMAEGQSITLLLRDGHYDLVQERDITVGSWVVNKIAQSRKGAKLTLYIGKVDKVSDTVDLHYVSEPLNTSMAFYSFPDQLDEDKRLEKSDLYRLKVPQSAERKRKFGFLFDLSDLRNAAKAFGL